MILIERKNDNLILGLVERPTCKFRLDAEQWQWAYRRTIKAILRDYNLIVFSLR